MKKKEIQMSGRKIKEMLRLRSTGVGLNHCAQVLNTSASTIFRWKRRCEDLCINYSKASEMTEEALHAAVCFVKGPKPERYFPTDLPTMASALEAGSTKLELYEEYARKAQASGDSLPALKKSAFYARLDQYLKLTCQMPARYMVQQWLAGEYMQIDYAGDAIELKEGPDGKKYKVRIFVCTLCFSRLSFWYGTKDMTCESWIKAIVRAIEYFGGLPKYILLDNDTGLVNRAEQGNKIYNRHFLDLCAFYDLRPAAVRRATPQDKGQVEEAVNDVTHKFIKKIVSGSLASVKDVNLLLRAELEKHNNRKMMQYGISRREWFNKYERSKLRALPRARFNADGILHERKVYPNGCVSFDKHQYMMPPQLINSKVKVKESLNGTLVFLDPLHQNELCSYPHYQPGVPDPIEGFIHIRAEYRAPGELTPKERLDKAVEKISLKGPYSSRFLSKFLKRNEHNERGQIAEELNWLSAKLKPYSEALVEEACELALDIGSSDKHLLIAYLQALSSREKTMKKVSTNPNQAACMRPIEEITQQSIH